MADYKIEVGREEKHKVVIRQSASSQKGIIIVDGKAIIVVDGRGLKSIRQFAGSVVSDLEIGKKEKHTLRICADGTSWPKFKVYLDGKLVHEP